MISSPESGVRTFRNDEAPVNTDHILLVSELLITLSKSEKSRHNPKLQSQQNVTVYKFSQLGDLPDNVDKCWKSFCTMVHTLLMNSLHWHREVHTETIALRNTFAVIGQKVKAKATSNHSDRK